MTRRRFRVISARQRREADLFFADLMGGGVSGEAVDTSGEEQHDADLFLVDLFGRSIDHPSVLEPTEPRPVVLPAHAEPMLLPTADFSEQPAPAAAAAAMPVTIPVNWAGIDRRSIPKQTVGGQQVGDTAWMGTLLDNSNLRFTGAYVAGAALAGSPPANFTNSSKATSRGWLANIQILADQGWGVVFFYVGYSVGGGEPAPAGVDRARGTEHGLHLRTTLNALGAAWAGATVFIDNEDPVPTNLPNDLVEYYVGLFDEMSRPDPHLAAFRPAMYGHGQPLKKMLARRRDLFLWDVKLATAATTTPTLAFDPAVDPITIDAAARPIQAYGATPAAGAPFVTWALGRQYWYYTGAMPRAGSAVAARLPTWRKEKTWDYNVSFVRNPAFPVAEPRVAARRHRTAAVVIADFFQPRGGGATPTPPLARVVTQGPAASAALTLATGVTVEPDAPLTLFPRGTDMLLATVLSGGDIGVATRNAAGTWSAIDRMAGTAPALRRSRALQGVSNTVSNAHLFLISSDHRLYVKRLQRSGTWSDGQPAAADLRLHPFSALAGEARRGDTVDTFFIDEQGLLTTAYWARWFTTAFPGFLVQRLQTTPSLLPGGALAAVCPQPDHLLVFGVGNDLRLQFAAFLHGRGWAAVTALGAAQDFIGAHTRLAAHAVNATEVEVAALTDSGQLAIYTLTLSGTTWSAGARQVIADPPAQAGAAPAAAATVLQPANGFRINPFGDLSILRMPADRTSTVLCAGVGGNDARTLRWNAAGPDAWQSFTV